MLKIGDKSPEFSLNDQSQKKRSLKEFKGSWVVLYFYPKDNTPGCTVEAIDFTKHLKAFQILNTTIIGMSPDSVESHCRFIDNQNLKIILLSDENHSVIEKYGAWQLKKNYGKEYMGVQRSTFLIDSDGRIQHIWPKVKVEGHVEEVLNTVRMKSK